jgi:hypothetical protein
MLLLRVYFAQKPLKVISNPRICNLCRCFCETFTETTVLLQMFQMKTDHCQSKQMTAMFLGSYKIHTYKPENDEQLSIN